jgi:hypothetical protein
MPNENKSHLLPMAAGCVSGAIEATCVWPMEYIKTQLQLNPKGAKLPYNGTISGLVYTVKTTGNTVLVFLCRVFILFSRLPLRYDTKGLLPYIVVLHLR